MNQYTDKICTKPSKDAKRKSARFPAIKPSASGVKADTVAVIGEVVEVAPGFNVRFHSNHFAILTGDLVVHVDGPGFANRAVSENQTMSHDKYSCIMGPAGQLAGAWIVRIMTGTGGKFGDEPRFAYVTLKI